MARFPPEVRWGGEDMGGRGGQDTLGLLPSQQEVIYAAPTPDTLARLNHFAPPRSRRTWRHVPMLIVGALLVPGRRDPTAMV